MKVRQELKMESYAAYGDYSDKTLLACDGWFDMRALLVMSQMQLGAVAKARGIHLEMEVSEQTPRYFLGNPLRVNDILNNLGACALKHDNDSTIFFTVDAYPVQQNQYQMDITVTTSDGGISACLVQKGFSTCSQNGGGKGHRPRCLNIVQQLVSRLGGELIVENTSGCGTRYCAHLIMTSEVQDSQSQFFKKRRISKSHADSL
jgi:sensor histidine kinase regulating citrate/malate metabolism